ncbi:hypothetical protein E2I00_006072 [Balaenoptera physalus]|uniref:CRAL-TRIO domain-containing protein n=1 Tax=Balaenoptera physalus TaxID=9770 RepID=A0A643C829_BALPH|nr:hypothetical protein E2I00_006072 [Balaenoptera physalus]
METVLERRKNYCAFHYPDILKGSEALNQLPRFNRYENGAEKKKDKNGKSHGTRWEEVKDWPNSEQHMETCSISTTHRTKHSLKQNMCMGAFDMEFLNFFDSRNISEEHLQENCFKLESFHSGTIMQAAGRIYLTFSQLLNQLEIIDSPSAVIKMERLNEEGINSDRKAHNKYGRFLIFRSKNVTFENQMGQKQAFLQINSSCILNRIGETFVLADLHALIANSDPERIRKALSLVKMNIIIIIIINQTLLFVPGGYYLFRVRVAVREQSMKWSLKDLGSLDYQELVVDIESRLRMEGVELKEEWQDEDFPIPLPEDDSIEADILAVTGPESQPDDLPKPKTTEVIRKGSITEYTAAEEKEDGRRWRMFRIGEQDHRVDMKAIEPYKKVISHGGYYGDGLNAIVVFAVCFMPESGQPNYRYLMDNLFKYVIGTLELLVAENYMIVYLNGATTRRKMPSLGWLRKCYQQIDRRLRKNLKSLIIVHPSWFIRTLLAVTRPFISSKFSQKIRYVFNLAELAELVPMEYVGIPECIKQYVLFHFFNCIGSLYFDVQEV